MLTFYYSSNLDDDDSLALVPNLMHSFLHFILRSDYFRQYLERIERIQNAGQGSRRVWDMFEREGMPRKFRDCVRCLLSVAALAMQLLHMHKIIFTGKNQPSHAAVVNHKESTCRVPLLVLQKPCLQSCQTTWFFTFPTSKTPSCQTTCKEVCRWVCKNIPKTNALRIYQSAVFFM